jgi:hypothetical protein
MVFLQLAVEVEFVEESLSILRVGRGRLLGFESVERHECNTSDLLLQHVVEDIRGGFVGIDSNVKEAISSEIKERFGEWPHLLPAVSSTAMLNLESVTSKRRYRGPY